ncbi:carbohydrate ABC transporter permease [Acidipropionibacterium virtanenii]|uniref:sn-glycerol-3-phosphate transport system permease protein UgpA n=1 Tax=Acidipropionibacterium virtanenii TaxID=2057246 RepID=A0A344UPS3_9ACTN|nr:sugar ABC transporter permease [Acidipropionibacterium virtanenii]AXE37271.1 sn-glycerol-3-phosphate transport system permease protein UgpA [Acidipropionibacterium virtanenii]
MSASTPLGAYAEVGTLSGAPEAPEALPPARKRHRHWSFDKVSFFAVFLGVPLIIYLVFVVSPFIQAFYYSLTNWGGFSATFDFVALKNYVRLLGDDVFQKAMVNNVLLAVFVPLITIVLSLILATMITVGGSSYGQTRGLSRSGFYRVVSFFPYCVPAVVIGLMWGQIFDPSHGLVNGILTKSGAHWAEEFAWLGEKSTAMPVSMFVMIWAYVGFYMLLFIAGIKSIPAEIFEAARIDGAGRFRTAVSITVPLIRDNVQTAWIYLGIASLDAFVYMSVLNPFGGPGNSTLVMSQQLFQAAFSKGQYGLACAMGVVIAIMTMIFAGIVALVNRLTGGKDTVTMA